MAKTKRDIVYQDYRQRRVLFKRTNKATTYWYARLSGVRIELEVQVKKKHFEKALKQLEKNPNLDLDSFFIEQRELKGGLYNVRSV